MSQDNENQDLKTIWAAIIEKVSPTQKATFVLVANPGIIFFSLILVIVFKTSWLAIPVALVATAATFWVTRGLRTIIIELEEKIYSLRTENEDKQKRLNNFAELIKKNGGGKPSGANGAMIDESTLATRIEEKAIERAKGLISSVFGAERVVLAKLLRVKAQTAVTRPDQESRLVTVIIEFHSEDKSMSFKDYLQKITLRLGKGSLQGTEADCHTQLRGVSLDEYLDEGTLAHSWNDPGECRFVAKLEAFDPESDTLFIAFPSTLGEGRYLVVEKTVGIEKPATLPES